MAGGGRWVRMNVDYLRNPKITAVSRDAMLLHFASILWTADQEQDGAVPAHTIKQLAHETGMTRTAAVKAAAELMPALWIPNGDGWHIHDFEVINRQAMSDERNAERERWAKTQRQSRERRRSANGHGDVTP